MWGREETETGRLGRRETEPEGQRRSHQSHKSETTLKKKSPSVPTANECRGTPRKRPPPQARASQATSPIRGRVY